MPKKGPRSSRTIVYYDNHNEHDDRVPLSSDSTRRVSFKNYGSHRHKNQRQRGRDDKMRAALSAFEDDIDMISGGGGGFRYNRGNHFRGGAGYRGGRSSIMRRDSPHGIRKLPESPFQFYKVVIPEGQKYEREYILGLLQSYIRPLTLTPLGYKKQGESVSFFVDDFKVAQQILQADRKMITSDNWRLSMIVRANVSQVDMDDGIKAVIKMAMSGRYNTINKALDLSKFHLDPVLLKEDAYCPLNRSNVMNEVIDIIGSSIPDLLALNLSDNKLVNLECLKRLKTKVPSLKVLHIGKNNIRSLDQFDNFGLQIEELELDGNGLCDKFREKEAYIREVQKRFPKVIKLDGIDVPRMITFNVEEEIALVKSQGSFLCDPAASEVIRPFLQQYYTLYDSNNRAPLIDAYHEDCQFSLSCTSQGSASSSFGSYIPFNRNLMVVASNERRKRLLKRGKTETITFLESLPRSQHDPTSFTVDCPIFTPAIIMLSVTGVFREVNKKHPMRSFQRSFTIVPVGAGFCIINELYHISLATSDQVKDAFKAVEATPAPVAPPVAAPVALPGPSAVPVMDITIQQQMVTTLAAQSNMNLSWAEKCLVENGWDFNRALYVFTELHNQGKIPAEAFIK